MPGEISRSRNCDGRTNRRSFTESDMDLHLWFRDRTPEDCHPGHNKPGYTGSISWNSETGFGRWPCARIETPAALPGFPNTLDFYSIHDTGDTHASKLTHPLLHASENIAPGPAGLIIARLLERPDRNAIRVNQGAVSGSF